LKIIHNHRNVVGISVASTSNVVYSSHHVCYISVTPVSLSIATISVTHVATYMSRTISVTDFSTTLTIITETENVFEKSGYKAAMKRLTD